MCYTISVFSKMSMLYIPHHFYLQLSDFQDSMRKSIIVRSSSSVMMKKNTCPMIKTSFGKISLLIAHYYLKCSSRKIPSITVLSVFLLSGFLVNFDLLLLRTEWERERENHRDCQSSLSSGEPSYPQETSEESYSYQHHHHEPPRKTSGRYPSVDTQVTTHYVFFPL